MSRITPRRLLALLLAVSLPLGAAVGCSSDGSSSGGPDTTEAARLNPAGGASGGIEAGS